MLWRKLFSVFAIAAGLSLAPIALSPSGGLVGNKACADGDSCAPEAGSYCTADDGSALPDYRNKYRLVN